jgi:hypothetical protein
LILSQTITAQRTGTVTYTIANGTGARSISAVIAGGGNNLTLSVSPTTINGSGSAVVTIKAKTGAGNRGTFLVKISSSPGCGNVQQVAVTVNN